MKLKLPLILLGAVLAATAQAAEQNITFEVDNNVASNATMGNVKVKVGSGDYKDYNMFVNNKDGYIAGAAHKIDGVLNTSKSNKDEPNNQYKGQHYSSTDIIVGNPNDTTESEPKNIKAILGEGIANNTVVGNKNITVYSGIIATIFGSVSYESQTSSNLNFVGNKIGENCYAYKNKKNPANINIDIYGGTIGQIRGGSSGKHQEYIVTPCKDAMANGTYDDLMQNKPWSISGDVNITINGGTVGTGESSKAIMGTGGSGHSVDGKVTITITDGTVDGNIYAGGSNTYAETGYTEVNISGGVVTGSVHAGGIFDDGPNRAGYEGPAPTIKYDTSVNITGGTIKKDVYGAGWGDTVEKNTHISVHGGTIEGNIYGGGISGEAGNGSVTSNVKGNTSILITGGDIDGSVYGGGTAGSKVGGNTTIELLGGNITGTVSGYSEGDTDGSSITGTTTLKVGTAEHVYTGRVGSIGSFSKIVVAERSSLSVSNGNIFTVKHLDITLNALNLTQAALNTSTANVEGAITLNITSNGKLESGKYMVIQTEEPVSGWSTENVSVSGIAGFNDLEWQGNVLYYIYRGSNVDALAAANWGVFKSSQAFVNTLRGPRTNAITVESDGKDGYQPLVNCVWGSVYGHSSRIGSNGADYTLWGGAIGAERALSRGRSIGAAIGYDWGNATPFTTTGVDQETFHLGLYGRAWNKQLNSTDSIAIDWSAAYGNTTSSHSSLPGDWSQNSLQLDARGSFFRALSAQTAVNLFAGMQYYTQGSDTTGGIKATSLQNLRLQAGAGITHTINRATWFGEIALHQDLLRDNPKVKTATTDFGCTNPGRFGATISAGVEYRLNNTWSLNAQYSFSTADEQTEHNISAGAGYKF